MYLITRDRFLQSVVLMFSNVAVRAVGTAPELVEELSDLTIVAPETASLQCTVSPGQPTADIHWFYKDKEIYKNKKYQMSYSDSVAVLTINGSEPKDTGAYRCEAFNKVGRVQTQCTLNIQSMCPRYHFDYKT